MRQVEFQKVNGWGGKRRRAGRKNKTKTVNHMKRANVCRRTPLHITLRRQDLLPSFRQKWFLVQFKKSAEIAKKQGLRLLQFSILSNHIHIIIEADSNKKLASGMRSFVGRTAKSFRAAIGGKGAIFSGRYHLHIIDSPRAMKNALEYVLLNDSKHRRFIEYIDHFSSARSFSGWKKLLGLRFKNIIREQLASGLFVEKCLSQPFSWLAGEGWQRACG